MIGGGGGRVHCTLWGRGHKIIYLYNIHFNISLKHVQCTHTCTCTCHRLQRTKKTLTKIVEKGGALEATVRELNNRLEAMEVQQKAELDKNKH